MIRVGKGKPQLRFVEGHNDMSHYFPSSWEVNNYFYMDVSDYIAKKEFEDFDMCVPLEEGIKASKAVLAGEELTQFEHPWAYRMKKLIEKAHGQIWQFNAVDSSLSGRIRQVVILGQKTLVPWTWHDAYVILPTLKATARVLNALRSGKVEQEIKQWETFVEGIK